MYPAAPSGSGFKLTKKRAPVRALIFSRYGGRRPPTSSAIARSTPRALASRRAATRQSVPGAALPRWRDRGYTGAPARPFVGAMSTSPRRKKRIARRDTWVPPYRAWTCYGADRVVRPYETGRRGRRPLHMLSTELCVIIASNAQFTILLRYYFVNTSSWRRQNEG